MQKPIVFISHINEEKGIAAALKELVEASFIGMMDVFVASDPQSVRLGQKWLDRITEGLKRCVVEIIIASPASVKRPWINFEGGAGWIREVPVIPLCHSGMTPEKLPAPLNLLQGAVATDEAQLKLIFPVLATALGSGHPQTDFLQFIATVKKFETTTQQIEAITERIPVSSTAGLAPHELAALVSLAENISSPTSGLSFNWLKRILEKAGYNGLGAMLAVKKLERANLVMLFKETDPHDGEPFDSVGISDEGWNWLETNKDKLITTMGAVSADDEERLF